MVFSSDQPGKKMFAPIVRDTQDVSDNPHGAIVWEGSALYSQEKTAKVLAEITADRFADEETIPLPIRETEDHRLVRNKVKLLTSAYYIAQTLKSRAPGKLVELSLCGEVNYLLETIAEIRGR